MDLHEGQQPQELTIGAVVPGSAGPEMLDLERAAGIPIPPDRDDKKTSSPLRDSLRRLRRDKRAMISLGFILFLVLFAIAGPPIYQHIGGPYVSNVNDETYYPWDYHNYYHEELDRQHEMPSAQYWLGTDDIGRDILARLMQGTLVSLVVALVVEIIDVVFGIIIGVLAGYYGGLIDYLLAGFTDVMFAFPGLLFVILLTGIFGTSSDDVFSHIPVIGANGNARLLLVSLALAFTAWPLMARYVRGQTLQLKEQQFVEAARTVGTSDMRIIMRHIVPNLFSIVVVAATLDISSTIVGEAGISMLGLGVQAPGSSIGLMIASGSQYVGVHPWEVLIPCVTLALIVLAFSFIGDGLRDAFDPRSKD
ncbi:MAG TPA: ABC transporter permease [Ktedonobacteraceae bacterium]